MARTVRVKRRTTEKVRDGYFQYASRSCSNHGGCGYCEQNRTFSRVESDWDKDVNLYGWPDADPCYMMEES